MKYAPLEVDDNEGGLLGDDDVPRRSRFQDEDDGMGARDTDHLGDDDDDDGAGTMMGAPPDDRTCLGSKERRVRLCGAREHRPTDPY